MIEKLRAVIPFHSRRFEGVNQYYSFFFANYLYRCMKYDASYDIWVEIKMGKLNNLTLIWFCVVTVPFKSESDIVKLGWPKES